ncbi:MAG: hypothetical protein OWQ54_03360 [Sulfolobaceae archaeon]|nr:hypothetical protein [Sulfolobaceae archaeon]
METLLLLSVAIVLITSGIVLCTMDKQSPVKILNGSSVFYGKITEYITVEFNN